VSVIEYVHGVGRGGIVVFYVADVFFVAYCYWSSGLSDICVIACITFKLVDSTGIGIVRFL
jgi:hypothetical protein